MATQRSTPPQGWPVSELHHRTLRAKAGESHVEFLDSKRAPNGAIGFESCPGEALPIPILRISAKNRPHAIALRAKGRSVGDGFVITAGSEIASAVNASADEILRQRHRLLKESGALPTIPGVTDRLRLVRSIAVGSAAIAAKLVCGGHAAASLWRPSAVRQLSAED